MKKSVTLTMHYNEKALKEHMWSLQLSQLLPFLRPSKVGISVELVIDCDLSAFYFREETQQAVRKVQLLNSKCLCLQRTLSLVKLCFRFSTVSSSKIIHSIYSFV